MTKKFAVLLMIAALLSMNIAAFSHPASTIEVKQDKAKGMLIITITHPVKDVVKHFIKQIVIKINGAVVKTIKPVKQTNKTVEMISVKVGAYKKGSKIEVSATCNIRGVKTVTVIGL